MSRKTIMSAIIIVALLAVGLVGYRMLKGSAASA